MPTCFRLVSLLICWESDQNFLWGLSGMWGFGKVWLWSSVSVFNSLAIRQLSKKAVTVVHFEISAKGAKPNQIGCGGKLWGGPLYWLVASGCPLWAIPGSHRLWHLCKIHVTSMWEELHLCDVHMSHMIWPPRWSVQLKRTPFLFVISTMLLICTSYTVTFYIIQTNIFH